MATPNNEYIVFEPDQVLTNTDLNEFFNYLDQQNRWTRNKLLGIGIACGLDLVQHPGVIEITKGCGITSEGYLIQLSDTPYAYYMPYAALPQPQDLPFTYTADGGRLPFYQPFCQELKTVYLLLSDTDYNALDDSQKAQAPLLSKLQNLSDWLVVLFLEVREKDMANCDTNDCDNKGERMIFTVRPLLVNKRTWQRAGQGGITGKAPEIRLKRYNVPAGSLQTSADVLNAFASICDNTTLTQVQGAINYCFQNYASFAPNPSAPLPFTANYLSTIRDKIVSTAPLQIEYFYDFVNDLILAYYEFRKAAQGRTSTCCPDELLFPLHLILGEADHTTNGFVRDPYRQYFVYSGLFDQQQATEDELTVLLTRMQTMVATFAVPATRTIRITPSQYQDFPLSSRAIPWYYTEKKDDPGSVYQYWNFERTAAGNAAFNLSYNAAVYNSDPAIKQPLLYDIEPYHFFRIEGHVGQTYETALKNLLAMRQEYNLPFDVVAVSAELLKVNTSQLPECNIRDLITDYRLVLTGFACRLHTVYCFLTKAPWLADGDEVKLLAELNQYLQGYSTFKQTAATNDTPLALPFDKTDYAKGDFMRAFCPPTVNDTTIGQAYLTYAAFKRRFQAPEPVRNIYAYIDLVESLMLLLIPGQLSALNSDDLNDDWKAYAPAIYSLLLTEERATLTADNILLVDTLALASSCLGEELLAIYTEYIRRLNLYQSQLSLLDYWRKHPGLEHKAGVPKGGTFVMVYHQEQAPDTTGVRTNLPKSELLLAQKATGTTGISATLNLADYEALNDFVTQCKDAPTAIQKKVIDIISAYRPKPAATGPTIGADIVIADFYIPYLCCSDCAPVAYILKNDQPPPAVFDLPLKKYLFDDAHNYQFTTTPPVTTANAEQKPFPTAGVIDNPQNLNLWTDAQNNLYLHPADPTVQASFTTTLTYADIPITINIVKPDASFTVTVTTDPTTQTRQLSALAANTDASDYLWTYNGKTLPAKTPELPSIAFNAGDTIGLTVTYNLGQAISTDAKTQTMD